MPHTLKRADTNAESLLAFLNTLAGLQSLDDQLVELVKMVSAITDADRGTIFLHDDTTGELYVRVSEGGHIPEIRVSDEAGVVGHVYTTGVSLIIPEAYADSRFNPEVDEQTGYRTQSILCVPIRSRRGELMGVAQALNSRSGKFSQHDLDQLELVMQQASIVMHGSVSVARLLDSQKKDAEFLHVVAEISSEIQLGPLLRMIISMVTRMLSAERSTLFLHDPKTSELYTEVGEGLGATRIRFPHDKGIAGTVFQTGETVNIPYAYADLRFNPAFDRQTGFFTRSLLCVPVLNKRGAVIGVTQVLNKIGGTFHSQDEIRLKAFSSQIAVALENARLFEDVQNIKNYNESILESMSNGVVTFDAQQRLVTCNQAGQRIFGVTANDIVSQPAAQFLGEQNSWLREKLQRVETERKAAITMDAELAVGNEKRSVNVTVLPLTRGQRDSVGSMVLIEDISREKRMMSTMSRYMDPGIAERLLKAGEEILGGQSQMATVLFSDIRGFTTLTEELGAQGTVTLLNDYFTIMVDCIQKEEGMLDKFIGDAIMAVFGTPIAHQDDPDRAVRAAISMLRELRNFNALRATRGQKPIDIGVGLNTDQIVTGNIGSPRRMDYTVIGDGVNLASRLEGACKQYGAHILISQNTLDMSRDTYRTRQVDAVIVKGKTEPVQIYEVLDYHTEESFPHMRDVLELFRSGLDLYHQRQWDKAIAEFEHGLELHPHDKAAQLYIERCHAMKLTPPPDGWAGVWVMDHK